jgi:branched-chain amino acid transport system permease protein
MMKKMSRVSQSNFVTCGLVLVVFGVVQLLISAGQVSSLMQGLLVPVCTYSILAVSLNLTVGVLGELSLGHAGFMCVGAFASAFFSACTMESIESDMVRFVIALVIASVSAGLVGALIGIPVLRLRGDYLAIVTLAFGEIIKNVFSALYVGADEKGFHMSLKDSMSLNLSETGKVLIKGAQGITGTPKLSTFVIGIVLLLLTIVIVQNLMNSRSGRAIMAIRDNRIAAESVGINITKYKILAFSLSAALAGMAGCLYAHNLSSLTATPKSFGYNMSIMILVFVVLGGMGNIRGSVIAAVVLTLLPELLRGLSEYRMLIYAVVLVALMIFNWSPKVNDWRERHGFKDNKWIAKVLKHKGSDHQSVKGAK